METKNIKKAGERLIWRLKPDEKGNYKLFKPNKDDFNALKTILDYITASIEEERLDNALFAKLYIYTFCDFIRKYESDVLDGEVKFQLDRLLSAPIETFYESFNNDINGVQLDRMIGRCKKENDEQFTKDELSIYFNKETQVKTLNHMITEALNSFK